ncbi:MAG: M23 family metallopeptidase [Vicinamibacterales bacterium]
MTSSSTRTILPWIAAASAVVLTTALMLAQAPASFSPLDMRVPVPPRPLVGGGQTHLAYEVHIKNLSPRPATIAVVEVRDGSGSRALLRLEGDGLEAALRKFGAPPDDPNPNVLGGGQSSVLFVWLSAGSGAVPRLLTHRVELSLPKADGSGTDAIAMEGLEVAVATEAPRMVGPPLEGEHWLAANGPDNNIDHRRTLLSLTGEARLAQRFAIDWVQLYDDGRTFRGDPLRNDSYRSFGANVLAVADGVVVGTLDGIPENTPDPVARAVPMTPRTLIGNYVLLDIGDGAWAVYAHLQLGSVRVRQGDRVRRGEVLGRVGNTGNSTEAHLHFHIADRSSPIDSEGIPYGFDAFEVEAEPAEVTRALRPAGQTLEVDSASLAEWFAREPQPRRNEVPLLNALVAFPSC